MVRQAEEKHVGSGFARVAEEPVEGVPRWHLLVGHLVGAHVFRDQQLDHLDLPGAEPQTR